MNKFLSINKKLSKGFTLIELLIVIAVLGVLAAVVLVAIDPVQQLARGRDAGRKSSIGQLGRAIQAYYTVHAGYPTVLEWTTAPNKLTSSGEIKTFPSNPVYAGAGFACTSNPYPAANGYCYAINPTPEVVVDARLESLSENSKCPAAAPVAWFVFSSADGRAGVICLTAGTQPGAGPQSFL